MRIPSDYAPQLRLSLKKAARADLDAFDEIMRRPGGAEPAEEDRS